MTTDVRLDAGDGGWVAVEAHGLKVGGADILLEAPERRGAGGGANRRALVHDMRDGLTINWKNDYPGGVTINNARMDGARLTSARLNLEAVQQVDGKLPAEAAIGDLVMLRSSSGADQVTVGEDCSLWLCVPGGLSISEAASWREVKLGERVRGSV